VRGLEFNLNKSGKARRVQIALGTQSAPDRDYGKTRANLTRTGAPGRLSWCFLRQRSESYASRSPKRLAQLMRCEVRARRGARTRDPRGLARDQPGSFPLFGAGVELSLRWASAKGARGELSAIIWPVCFESFFWLRRRRHPRAPRRLMRASGSGSAELARPNHAQEGQPSFCRKREIFLCGPSPCVRALSGGW
jgi:hypothetical protein